MTTKWCLQQCRFYRGENECPEVLTNHGGVWSVAWFMERLWVEQMTSVGYIPITYSEQYNRAGLSDFNRDDGVHIDLKQFLYGYGSHRAEGILTADEFRHWYDFEYIPKGDFYKDGKLKK